LSHFAYQKAVLLMTLQLGSHAFTHRQFASTLKRELQFGLSDLLHPSTEELGILDALAPSSTTYVLRKVNSHGILGTSRGVLWNFRHDSFQNVGSFPSQGYN
jgi:hypothetical protein